MKKLRYFILPGFIIILIFAATYLHNYLKKEILYLDKETLNIQREIYKYKNRLSLVKKYIELKQKIPFKISIFKNSLDAKTYLLININNDIKKFKGILIEYKFLEKNIYVNTDNYSSDIIKPKKFNFKTLNVILTTKFDSYKKLIDFIKLLENEKYLFLINKIEIYKEGLKLKAIIKADYEYQIG